MMNTTNKGDWVDSWLACKDCGKHLMCDIHAQMMKAASKDFKIKIQHDSCKINGCEGR